MITTVGQCYVAPAAVNSGPDPAALKPERFTLIGPLQSTVHTLARPPDASRTPSMPPNVGALTQLTPIPENVHSRKGDSAHVAVPPWAIHFGSADANAKAPGYPVEGGVAPMGNTAWLSTTGLS